MFKSLTPKAVKSSGPAALAAALLLALIAAPAQAFDTEERKVVWHIGYDDIDRVSSMLGSINRMVQTYEGELVDYDVRVVMRSGGIRFATDDALEGSGWDLEPGSEADEERQQILSRLQSLHGTYGVTLELCDTTRQAVGLDRDAVMDNVEIVDSGIMRITELQQDGFAYAQVY